MTSLRQGVSSGHAHSVTAGSLFLQGEVKTKHTLRLSHMFLSSRTCAFLRLANIVSFVSKIYSRLPIRTDIELFCYLQAFQSKETEFVVVHATESN